MEVTKSLPEPPLGKTGSASPAREPVQPENPARERRNRPRVCDTPPAPPPPPLLSDYEGIVGRAEVDELRFLAEDLRGRTMKMVNSTALAGGVGEVLNRLVPLLTELQVSTHWDVITGGNDFY